MFGRVFFAVVRHIAVVTFFAVKFYNPACTECHQCNHCGWNFSESLRFSLKSISMKQTIKHSSEVKLVISQNKVSQILALLSVEVNIF